MNGPNSQKAKLIARLQNYVPRYDWPLLDQLALSNGPAGEAPTPMPVSRYDIKDNGEAIPRKDGQWVDAGDYDQLEKLYLKHVQPQQSAGADCDHKWVSARNEVITNGEFCPKCLAIRAEPSRSATDSGMKA